MAEGRRFERRLADIVQLRSQCECLSQWLIGNLRLASNRGCVFADCLLSLRESLFGTFKRLRRFEGMRCHLIIELCAAVGNLRAGLLLSDGLLSDRTGERLITGDVGLPESQIRGFTLGTSLCIHLRLLGALFVR